MRTPDFEELVGGEVAGEERERLRRAHEALVAAGPPPLLPATLAEPAPARRRGFLRRRALLIPLAAALAAATFLGGYLVGRPDPPGFDVRVVVEIRGTTLQPGATALLSLGFGDEGGNWPMLLEVRGLPKIEDRAGYYELALSRGGKPVATCGTFKVQAGTTKVRFTASYPLKRFDGWVVTAHPRGHLEKPPIVMST